MSTLTIIKKSNLVWLHEPSDKPKFIIGKFTFHIDGDNFQIVEIGQSKRNKYRYSDITIVDEVNSDTFSSFANITELSEKLAELGYLGFDTSYSTGVISVNGFTGIVLLTGNNFNVTNPHTSASSSLNQALEDVYNNAGGGGGDSQDIDQILANGSTALDKTLTLDSTPDGSYDILKTELIPGITVNYSKEVGSSKTYYSEASGIAFAFLDGANSAQIKPNLDGSGNIVPSVFKLPPTSGEETGATREWVDNKVAGLLDLRGNYDASVNAFPTTGGSGTSGAILKGDFWYVSVAGILNGINVNIGDSFYALNDSPSSSQWEILQANLDYVPEDVANKENAVLDNSTTKYPTNNLVFNERAPIVVSSNVTATLNREHNVTANSTFTDPTPTDGMGYYVNVINGVATVGGVDYGVGSELFRVYDGTDWVTYNKTDYIPLSGTTTGNPVTGNIESIQGDFKSNYSSGSVSFEDLANNFTLSLDTGLIQFIDGNTGQVTSYTNNSITKSSVSGGFDIITDDGNVSLATNKGISSSTDYSGVINDLNYTQKIYVDNQRGKLIQLTTAEILALTPEIGRLYYNTTINEVVFYNGTTWKKLSHSDM